MSSSVRARYDIIVSGGGIVGFTLLNLISKSPCLSRCNVLLLENSKKPSSIRQPPRVQHPSVSELDSEQQPSVKLFSNRVSSITNRSRDLYKKLGIWNAISEYAKPVNQIKVWNYNYANKIIFQSQDATRSGHQDDTVFTVVENNRLSIALLNSLLEENNSAQTIAWQCNLGSIIQNQEPGLIDVTYTNHATGESCSASAPLLLGCDGYNSKVRQLADIKLVDRELDKSAVVGTVKLDLDNELNDTAFQRFSAEKESVAALLPLDSEHSSFVISAPDSYANHLVNCDDETFTNEFNQLISGIESPRGNLVGVSHQVSDIMFSTLHSLMRSVSSFTSTDTTSFDQAPRVSGVVENSRATFPLKNSMTLDAMVAKMSNNEHYQIALLGDSAHRVHPLAGQGLNMGIQDCQSLVNQIEEYATCGERIFNQSDLANLNDALKRYDRERRILVAATIAGISQMENLFEITPPSVISLFNRLEPLKSVLVKAANGC